MGIEVDDIGWNAESSVGAVAAGGAGSVAAGIEILEAGGNAADAAAGTILALNVTDHYACSIGGEVPLLYFSAESRAVTSLSGMGSAPRSQEAIDWYMANGIPGDGDIKMAPVPSVVDLVITTLQTYGTKSFEEVSGPAIALLDAGTEDWEPKLAHTLRRMVEEEKRTTGSREEKLQAACDRFYGRHAERNDIAEELEAFYIEKGGFIRREDLAAHRTRIEKPVTVDYKGHTVCKCDTWTQGPMLLQALRLVEGFDLKGMGRMSPDYVHVLIEALKLAMADRDTYYGDPEFVNVPLDVLLGDAYTEIRQPLIDMAAASLEARPGDPHGMKPLAENGVYRPGGDGTTTCAIADRWGNVVAATPSANVHRPTVDGGKAGVTYGNRLRSLNTTPGHPNCIQPGKRPRITLTPTMVLKAGKPVLSISVAGGDRQDQVTLKLLLDYLEFGLSPADSVTGPRFVTMHHQDSFDPNPAREETFVKCGGVDVGSSMPSEVVDELKRRGHVVNDPGRSVGNPVMLQIDDEAGVFRAAGDPKAGRHAAGLGS